ncbi:hypothetical protein HDU93_004525 [Gonapodya sp. JEL0774]|nr:hypothetical protein HDU93_004525 [Gonapodya sp. JEL0774]
MSLIYRLIPFTFLVAATSIIGVSAQSSKTSYFVESGLTFPDEDYVHEMVLCPGPDGKQQLQLWYWNDAGKVNAVTNPDFSYTATPLFEADTVQDAIFDNMQICVGKTQCGITVQLAQNLPLSTAGKLVGNVIDSFEKDKIGAAYYTSGLLQRVGKCTSVFWSNMQKHFYPVFSSSDDWTLLKTDNKSLADILADPMYNYCNAAVCNPTQEFYGKTCGTSVDSSNTCTGVTSPVQPSKFIFGLQYNAQADPTAYNTYLGLLKSNSNKVSGPQQTYEVWTFIGPESPYQIDEFLVNNYKSSAMVSLLIGPFRNQKQGQVISGHAAATMGYKITDAPPRTCNTANIISAVFEIGAAVAPGLFPTGIAGPIIAGALGAAGGSLSLAGALC